VRGAPEVRVLKQHVGGDQQVFGRAARAEDGAIVADSQRNGAAERREKPLAEAFQELQLAGAVMIGLDHAAAI